MRETLLPQAPEFIQNAYGGGNVSGSGGVFVGTLITDVGYFRLRNATAGLRVFIAYADISFTGGVGGRVYAGSSDTTQADTAMARSWLDRQKTTTPTADVQAGNRSDFPTFGAGGAQEIDILPGETKRFRINLIISTSQGYWIIGLHPAALQVTYWWFE